MTKRHPDQTPASSPPPPKHARQERSYPLDSNKQEIGSFPHPIPTQEQTDQFVNRVRKSLKFGIEAIYHGIMFALDEIEGLSDDGLISKAVFVSNFETHEDFSRLLMTACSDGATAEDKLALVTHGAYFFCPTNQVMTAFQTFFGLFRHPRVKPYVLLKHILLIPPICR